MTLAVVYVLWTAGVAYAEKNIRYWLYNWSAFFIPAIIFSLPFAYNVLSLSQSPLFFETNLRMGFINTHFPGSYTNIGLMIFCILILSLLWRYAENKKSAMFGFVLACSGIILNWQNVFTGKTLQFPPHFYPLCIFFLFLIAAVVFSEWKRTDIFKYSRWISVILLCVYLGGITYKQRGEILYAAENIFSPKDISMLQQTAGPLKWLEKNTPADSSVYVLGDEYNLLIPIYTHNNIYFSGNAGFSLVADTELENRWAIQRFFDTVNEKDIIGNREIWANKFIDAYQNKETRRKIKELLTGEKYPSTVLMESQYIARVREAHRKFQEIGFENALKTYEADYVLIDAAEGGYKEVSLKIDQYSFLELAATFGEVKIYKVK
jgi:hypothetical protein